MFWHREGKAALERAQEKLSLFSDSSGEFFLLKMKMAVWYWWMAWLKADWWWVKGWQWVWVWEQLWVQVWGLERGEVEVWRDWRVW